MGRGDNHVTILVDEFDLLFGKASPKQKNKRFLSSRENFDDGIREFHPAKFGVRIGLLFLDGEACIEKKNPLLCPWTKISCFGDVKPKISMELFVHISQGRRNFDARLNREG